MADRGIEPILKYIRLNFIPGDVIYLFQKDSKSFSYYQGRLGFRNGDFISGIPHQASNLYDKEIAKISRYRRAWILFKKGDEQFDRYAEFFESSLRRQKKAVKSDSFSNLNYRCVLYVFDKYEGGSYE